jgi:hypothetical protein
LEKCDRENPLFQELLSQAIATAKYLRTIPEYASEVAHFLETVNK